MSRVIDRGNFRHGSSTSTRGPSFPSNFRSVRPPTTTENNHERSHFQRNYIKEWLMERPNYQKQLPNFVIELQLGRQSFISKPEVEGLLKECTSTVSYDKLCVSPLSLVRATLSFRQWNDALEVFVFLWSKRLEGAHELKPNLICNVFVPSDKDEIRVRLKDLFSSRVRRLLDGEEVQRWRKRVDVCSDEIVKVQSLLKRKYNKIQELDRQSPADLHERKISNRIETKKDSITDSSFAGEEYSESNLRHVTGCTNLCDRREGID